jgi:hypothetical protein
MKLGALAGRPAGIAWMELAALSWAVGTILIRRSRMTLPAETLTVWMMTLTSLCLWVAGVRHGALAKLAVLGTHVGQPVVRRLYQLRLFTDHLVWHGTQSAARHQRHEHHGRTHWLALLGQP